MYREKVLVSGNCVSVAYSDYAELEKPKRHITGYAKIAVTNSKCDDKCRKEMDWHNENIL